MNLNPLQKDDNTDALVQALQDANNAGVADNTTVNAPMPNPSVGSSDSPTNADVSGISDTLAAPADPTAGLSIDTTELPAGMSSDADAHLPTLASGDSGELDDVKKSALQQLRPLIEKLDLEPNDKFDKYLMMLRASDDPALIKPAFDAAQGITGEKEKAQALLDIINEINYITANQQQS